MKLKKLFKTIPVNQIKGSREVEITGICSHSKAVSPGNLFIAKHGAAYDGNRFIAEAISAGAVAVLTNFLDPFLNVVQVIHHDVASIEADVAATYYQFPSDELFTVGITGTNGKTTSAYIIKHLLDSLNLRCGLISTIQYCVGNHYYEASRTTPDVILNQKLLRDMVTSNCLAAVMEVTSHGLIQGRVRHIDYDVAIFTNLSLDHLDYHKTMENYCEAKAKLFNDLHLGQDDGVRKKKIATFPKCAVINIDDPWHEKVMANCQTKILTYGTSPKAHLRATNIVLSRQGTQFDVTYEGQTVRFAWKLIGKFNVYNCLAATAVGLVRGISLEQIASIIAPFKTAPGRLEAVSNPRGCSVFVDYAHTPDALENVLQCLQEVHKGKIITVFGCGGDRDPSKRKEMAKVCQRLSDLSIVTSDNPRSEDPSDIIHEILKGFTDSSKYIVEIDRRQAIEKALSHATANDMVLIAGKGHETYQIFARKTVEFDDRQVAADLLNAK